MSALGIIAGRGLYPELILREARRHGETRLVLAAFEGETRPELEALADETKWMRVGQLGRLLNFFGDRQVGRAIMAGQITPKRLFDMRPDLKAIMAIARLKERNAETLFGAVADELEQRGVTLMNATTFLDDHLAPSGHIAGPAPHGKGFAEEIEHGWRIAKEVARLDIGQCVLVRKGTVLAVEGYDGTDATIARGGKLGGGRAVLVKVAKPDQDMRFDVPVIGPDTIKACSDAGVSTIVCETKKTLLLGQEEIRQLAHEQRITLWGKD